MKTEIKTNWDALSEEAKEVFADFYIYAEFQATKGSEDPSLTCPRDYHYYRFKCADLCETLFPGLPYFECPCGTYGSKSFITLKQCLIKDGWISDDI